MDLTVIVEPLAHRRSVHRREFDGFINVNRHVFVMKTTGRCRSRDENLIIVFCFTAGSDRNRTNGCTQRGENSTNRWFQTHVNLTWIIVGVLFAAGARRIERRYVRLELTVLPLNDAPVKSEDAITPSTSEKRRNLVSSPGIKPG